MRLARDRIFLPLAIALSLLSNALSAGVCATLCSARICCHTTAVNPAKASPCCANCQHAQKGSSISRKAEDCCAWIGKKVNQPTTFSKVIDAQQISAAAILPDSPKVPAFEATILTNLKIETENRAPPENCLECSGPRAPPIVSV